MNIFINSFSDSWEMEVLSPEPIFYTTADIEAMMGLGTAVISTSAPPPVDLPSGKYILLDGELYHIIGESPPGSRPLPPNAGILKAASHDK